MKIKIKLSIKEAIKFGVETEIERDVDLSQFSVEQRAYLAEHVMSDCEIKFSNFPLIFSENFFITKISLQNFLETETKKYITLNENEKIVNGKLVNEYGNMLVIDLYRCAVHTDAGRAEIVRLEKLSVQKKIEYDKLCAAAHLEHEREREENKKIDQQRKDKETQIEGRKIAQLTDAVERLGTELQQKKWAEKSMRRDEILGLIETETFAPLIANGCTILNSEKYHIDGDDLDENEKTTLTDEQFANALKIRELVPDAKFSYFVQNDASDSDSKKFYVIRLKKTVGEYNFKVDVEI
jgi:hypothetical protein